MHKAMAIVINPVNPCVGNNLAWFVAWSLTPFLHRGIPQRGRGQTHLNKKWFEALPSSFPLYPGENKARASLSCTDYTEQVVAAAIAIRLKSMKAFAVCDTTLFQELSSEHNQKPHLGPKNWPDADCSCRFVDRISTGRNF